MTIDKVEEALTKDFSSSDDQDQSMFGSDWLDEDKEMEEELVDVLTPGQVHEVILMEALVRKAVK